MGDASLAKAMPSAREARSHLWGAEEKNSRTSNLQ
jgi:hypothetical protein